MASMPEIFNPPPLDLKVDNWYELRSSETKLTISIPRGGDSTIDNTHCSEMLPWHPFVSSFSHHFLGWQNEETWIIFRIMVWSCSNLMEAGSFKTSIQIHQKAFVWRHYDLKMTWHLNTWESMSEKLYDVILTPFFVQNVWKFIHRVFVC